jgi:predicted ATPase with chaperone activity
MTLGTKRRAGDERFFSQFQTEASLALSARAHDKILRTARTIADLEEAPDVTATHLAEAVQYRRLDRNLFA